MTNFNDKKILLSQFFKKKKAISIAVSGGVDSMTLASFAHGLLSDKCHIFHAVSSAVPKNCTQRVQNYAETLKWNIFYIDAKELSDTKYLKNPVNRCYYCKKNLYSTISMHSDYSICSGNNSDDLSDFRPGLIAADEHSVLHPYIECHFSKNDVRKLASELNLTDIETIPASPCLSSRIETGIPIESTLLNFIFDTEELIKSQFGDIVVRCRVRHSSIAIELEPQYLDKCLAIKNLLSIKIMHLAKKIDLDLPILFEPYNKGSAFLGGAK